MMGPVPTYQFRAFKKGFIEMRYSASIIFVLLMLATSAWAEQPQKMLPGQAMPAIIDFAYGKDSERQKMDFWRARSPSPTPVVVMIHGGGWAGGDKTAYGDQQIRPYLKNGISVARINYRFILQAMEQGVEPPVKACLYDAARALQTIRAKSKEWNVDPQRIGATGSSAGACTSLWLALHDDLADPKSDNPIAHESTRLACAAVVGAQTSLDPKELRKWIPNAEYGGHAFGFAAKGRSRPEEFELLIPNRDRVLPWIKEYSPIELVSKDDPPILLVYPKEKGEPKLGTPQKDPTHSAIYGLKLEDKLKQAGVEVVLTYPARKDKAKLNTVRDFLITKLNATE
jgi:acetyl esterase/lipase